MVVGHVEVVWGLELKLEVIKVSTEKEVAVKKTYHRIVGCRMVVGIIGCKEDFETKVKVT